MSKRTITALAALALVACGGGAKQADSPGTCPDGTVLKGSDCIPVGDEGSSSSSASGASASSGGSVKNSDDEDKPRGNTNGDAATPSSATPYDKDAVEVELKRASRSIKASCGSATDDDGKATGPWGATKATVVLGRNGHVKGVTVPAPYDGKPVGDCAVHAFQRIQFPPYAGSTDVSVEWDIEITHPKP